MNTNISNYNGKIVLLEGLHEFLINTNKDYISFFINKINILMSLKNMGFQNYRKFI